MEKYLNKLAETARRETPPEIEITDQVMRAVNTRDGSFLEVPSPLYWMAGAVTLAAMIALVVFKLEWSAWTDPLFSAWMQIMQGVV